MGTVDGDEVRERVHVLYVKANCYGSLKGGFEDFYHKGNLLHID